MSNRMMAAVFFGVIALVTNARANDSEKFVGDWSGTLVAGPRRIPFIFHVRHDAKGDLAACLDSPSEKLVGLDVSSIEVTKGDSIAMKLAAVGGEYDAKLVDDGKSLKGEWKQRGAKLPLDCVASKSEQIEKVKGQERLLGTFEGGLEVKGVKLTLAFHIHEDVLGRLAGTFDSIDQGANGIPIGQIEFDEDGDTMIGLPTIGAMFDATLAPDANTLDGKWKQGPFTTPFAMKRVAKATTLNRPQTPKPPFPYQAIDVTYDNPAAKLTLAGTLTLPKGEGPFPAVLLITGSGPQDRDETIFEHRPFFVIADALTRAGIAVLRVDDRGVGRSTGSLATATSLDLAGDAAAGVEFLKQRAEIDQKRIGLLGHSEGGMIAPMLASKRQDIAFIVLLAGPGVNGEKILYAQSALIMRAQGAKEADIDANRKAQERMFAILKDPNIDATAAVAKLKKAIASADGVESDAKEGASDPGADAQVASVNSPWMRYFVTYEPLPALEQVRCPVLAMFGEKDLQVPAIENSKAMESVKEKRKDGSFELKVVPGVNHLFQKCATGAVDEYARIDQTIDETALAAIVDFVVARTK